jgi:hypothetical protein
MTFDEARNLCQTAGISAMIPHHFGMFAFNTLEPVELQEQAARPSAGWRCFVPAADQFFLLMPGAPVSPRGRGA